MRRVSLFLLCIGFVATSCSYDVITGDCVNNAMLGEDSCQCITPDNTYSQFSTGYLKPDLDDLSLCDERLPDLDEASEIRVCLSYRCATKKCGVGEIPSQDKRRCDCDGDNHFVGQPGSCACETGYVQIQGECKEKETCRDDQDYVEADNTCACKAGAVEVSGKCEVSLKDTCDKDNELYDAATNTCKCNALKHLEGEAGSCVCETGYVLIDGVCEAKKTCRDDQVYAEASNTCACPTNYVENSQRICVRKGECIGENETYSLDKEVCVCTSEAVRFGDHCIKGTECTDTQKRHNNGDGTCTCADGYTYIMDDCYKEGDSLNFGRYSQDAGGKILSPIEWQILAIQEDSALLISKDVLEQYAYHYSAESITWEDSNVRSYLNGFDDSIKKGYNYAGKGFIGTAFNAEERKWIKQVTNKNSNAPADWNSTPGGNDTEDRIFLLSHDEVETYFPITRSRFAKPTAYAMSNYIRKCKLSCTSGGCSVRDCNDDALDLCTGDTCSSSWLLRSPGEASNYAANFNGDDDDVGAITSVSVGSYRGFRPALYVGLSADRKDCGNNAMLGEENCQCVTPNNKYNRSSESYLDATRDDLHFCADVYKQDPEDSKIYVCNAYRCATQQCGFGEIPDDKKRACVCDGEKHFVSDEYGGCKCDEGDVYVPIKGACEEKKTCRDDQEYVTDRNECACPTNHVEADNACACPPDHVENSQRICVRKGECIGENETFNLDKEACVCVSDAVRFGAVCIMRDECSSSLNRVVDEATCTCAEGYTYVYDDCYQVGDTLTFGSYPQDADSDTPSPLVWQILDIKEDSALLISKYVLEQYAYHHIRTAITWEDSDARLYLNGLGRYNASDSEDEVKGFIDKAFTAEEQKWIKAVTNKNPNSTWNAEVSGGNDTKDRIFLLSHDETLTYFPTNKSRIAAPTPYAIRNGILVSSVSCSSEDACKKLNDGCSSDSMCSSCWWLRSPGNVTISAASVNGQYPSLYIGNFTSFSGPHGAPGLRPALYIKLSAE